MFEFPQIRTKRNDDIRWDGAVQRSVQDPSHYDRFVAAWRHSVQERLRWLPDITLLQVLQHDNDIIRLNFQFVKELVLMFVNANYNPWSFTCNVSRFLTHTKLKSRPWKIMLDFTNSFSVRKFSTVVCAKYWLRCAKGWTCCANDGWLAKNKLDKNT